MGRKDSASNDLVYNEIFCRTERSWFHVRGASGSHTVLKLGNKEDAGKEITGSHSIDIHSRILQQSKKPESSPLSVPL